MTAEQEATAALMGLGGEIRWIDQNWVKSPQTFIDERYLDYAVKGRSWYEVKFDANINRWRAKFHSLEGDRVMECAPFFYRSAERGKAACEGHHAGHGWSR